MNLPTLTSSRAVIPDRSALLEECRQRVSALCSIEEIFRWLRGIECPFTQEATLRVFRTYWHELESRMDDIAVYWSDGRCCLRFPDIDATISSLIRMAQERQEWSLPSERESHENKNCKASEAKLINITPATIKPMNQQINHNAPTVTDSHDTVYQGPVYQNSTVYNAPVTNNYYYNAPAQSAPAHAEEAEITQRGQTLLCNFPELLRSDEAQDLLRKAQLAGFLDEDMLPLCSRSTAALLANEIAERLQLAPRWTAFEQLWHVRTLRNYYQKGLECVKGGDVIERIKAALQ